MQRELASMLHQKNRLAALGLAVSKINHDLRNLLASAQLFSDQLSTLPDPKKGAALRAQPMRALERAIAFCQSTLSYGAAQEAPPERKTIEVEPLIEEVHEALGLGLDVPVRWIVAVERGLTVEADHDQLFRVLVNMARNAMQALEARGTRDPARDQIRITGRREGSVVVIEVSDTGPGVSEKALVHLFQAFQGSTRSGGAGLGLAIAAELVRAHGGDIRLVPGTIGATFSITIPDRAVDLNSRRGELARALNVREQVVLPAVFLKTRGVARFRAKGKTHGSGAGHGLGTCDRGSALPSSSKPKSRRSLAVFMRKASRATPSSPMCSSMPASSGAIQCGRWNGSTRRTIGVSVRKPISTAPARCSCRRRKPRSIAPASPRATSM